MNKDTWDLSKIIKDDGLFYTYLKDIEKEYKVLSNYKGKVLDNLYDVYKLYDDISIKMDKCYLYAHLGYYQNMLDTEWQDKLQKTLKVYDELCKEKSFIIPELLSNKEKTIIDKINSDKRLEEYRFNIEQLLRYNKHILSDSEEKLLSSCNDLFRLYKNIFSSLNNQDVVFDKIKDENNNKVALTDSNYIVYLSSKNRTVRKRAFNSLYKYYKNHINTFASLFSGKVNSNEIVSNLRGYSSVLSNSLYQDNISVDLYNNLIKVVNDNNNLMHKFYEIKKSILKVNQFHMYDTYVNIASYPDKKISYEKGKKMILNALELLGERYINDLKHIMNNRCIDVYPRKGKRSGAFEWGTYKVEPFVSLNYENNTGSVSTLAHELGHALHSYYSDMNNSYCDASYPIFLAEIASTVNEILLSEYLYNNTTNINEKIYYLIEFIDKFKSTVYRQTMFAEFEKSIHDMNKNKVSITADVLNNTYYELNKKYFGNNVVLDDNIKYEWARIPHFYTSFYVYKYATGFISALIITNKIRNQEPGFVNKYIEFLSSGGRDYPLNLLNKLGINIEDEKVLNSAFELLNEKIECLKKLLKESDENGR